jgi:transcriptional regulator with XRE-family HTH domain
MSRDFSKRLKQMRENRKLKASQVAEALGIAPSTYREWEYGRAILGHGPYVRLADILGVSLNELLRGESENDVGRGQFIQSVSEIQKLLDQHKRALESFF